MLQLKNIYKSYTTGNSTQIALDGINLKFRQSEFVVVLGPSGSGKTTFLNIIGGIERCDKGDLIVNSKSTKNFTKEEWAFYRNTNIGFIFKEHNLIPHLSIIENVQMATSLADCPYKEKKKRALDALDKVNIKDINRSCDKLSKEEMQRVAIARALVNDPEIILADEPTGNLDGQASLEIMNLIKELFSDKLVILVSQNANMAKLYATRVIEFRDAEVIYDSNPLRQLQEDNRELRLNKTRINFNTSFKLAIRDLSNKKLKTLIYLFISGINISIMAILIAIISGFNEKITNFENDTLNDFPIVINNTYTGISQNTNKQKEENLNEHSEENVVYPYDNDEDKNIHKNYIDDDYIEYIRNIDEDLFSAISYKIEMNMNILKKDDNGKISLIDTSDTDFYSYPKSSGDGHYLRDNYDLLYGYYPTSKEDVVLVLDKDNRLDKNILSVLGIKSSETVSFDDIIGREFKIISNDDFYKRSGEYFYMDSSQENLKRAYNSEKSTTISITGILRPKKDSIIKGVSEGILYSNEIYNDYIKDCRSSEIVTAQKNLNYNIITGQSFKDDRDTTSDRELSGINTFSEVSTTNTKDKMLCFLGDRFNPTAITIYPKDFDSKNEIISYLNKYNEGKDDINKIYYTDTSHTVNSIAEGILSCIMFVFICIAITNLVIAIIMVSMITYISISDRNKEICIFKLLGARDRDIKNLFNVQIALLGFLSGIIGIVLCYITIAPINSILSALTGLDKVVFLEFKYILLVLAMSILIGIIGATIPKNIALRKDYVKLLKK